MYATVIAARIVRVVSRRCTMLDEREGLLEAGLLGVECGCGGWSAEGDG